MVKALTRATAHKVTDALYWGTGIFFVLAIVLPAIVIMVIGLLSGTVPSEADGGVLGFGENYPAFDPQGWLLWVPAVSLLFLSLWTIPLPLTRFPGTSRSALITLSFTMTIIGTVLSIAFVGAPGIEADGVVAVAVIGAALVLFVLRALAGFLNLVPRSWREDAPKSRQPKKGKATVV
jgi:hypothetical protein